MFVVESEVLAPVEGQGVLTAAFSNRLHAVDSFPGFISLEVWQDRKTPGRFVMISRWESRDTFRAYMRSPANRASHARVPKGPLGPRPGAYREYDLVAE